MNSNNPCKSLIQPGYKHTEVGVIPDDWVEHTIGDLIEFEGGSQPDKSYFRATWKLGYVRLIQIRDYKTDKYETYVPTHLARRFCTEHDIMIGRYGPPVFQILRGIDGAYNVALIKAKPGSDIVCSYAYYFLKQDKLFSFIEKLSQRSSGQTGVDLKELRQYPLPLPPTKAEQEAIAKALSDTDALIESLAQLITKKRNIKQGAMQELLIGKKRLPGFQVKTGYKQTEVGVIPEDWEIVPIGKLIIEFRGGAPLKPSDFTGTGVKVLPKGGVGRTGWLQIDDSDLQFCSPTYAMNHPKNQVDESYTVVVLRDLVPSGPSIGLIVQIKSAESFVLAQGVYGFKVNQASVPAYLVHLSNTHWYRKMVNSIMVGSTQVHITNTALKQANIPLPPVDEQEAIATILSDMDAEIAALETKLAKTRQLKQGMMHNLLTGRIRLI